MPFEPGHVRTLELTAGLFDVVDAATLERPILLDGEIGVLLDCAAVEYTTATLFDARMLLDAKTLLDATVLLDMPTLEATTLLEGMTLLDMPTLRDSISKDASYVAAMETLTEWRCPL